MMDPRSSYKAYFTPEAEVSDTDAKRSVLRRLSHYAACVGLGVFGGAVGVALAIGLAILIQLRLPPRAVLTPGVIPLMVAATLAGLGVSWLVSQMARYSWPVLLGNSPQNSLQVILVSSVFASLAQVLFLFV